MSEQLAWIIEKIHKVNKRLEAIEETIPHQATLEIRMEAIEKQIIKIVGRINEIVSKLNV